MLGETKSKSSKRRWALPRGLLRQLQSQRTVQLQERLAAGDLWEDNDFVFATQQGRPIDPKQDRTRWVGLLAASGVRRARLHDARHSAATMLLVQGVDTRTVMALLGWTDHRVMQRYVHPVDELRQEASARIDGALWPDAHGNDRRDAH